MTIQTMCFHAGGEAATPHGLSGVGAGAGAGAGAGPGSGDGAGSGPGGTGGVGTTAGGATVFPGAANASLSPPGPRTGTATSGLSDAAAPVGAAVGAERTSSRGARPRTSRLASTTRSAPPPASASEATPLELIRCVTSTRVHRLRRRAPERTERGPVDGRPSARSVQPRSEA